MCIVPIVVIVIRLVFPRFSGHVDDDFFADQSVAETVRARGAGNGRAAYPALVDAGPIRYDMLHRQGRVLGGRGGDRSAYTATGRHRARGVPARRRLEGRYRGQPAEGLPMDTQLPDTAGQDRVLCKDAQQH